MIGYKQVEALMKDGYKAEVTSSGTILVRYYSKEAQEADINLPRAESIRISHNVLDKLIDKGIVEYDRELNDEEDPYEDHHPIHFRLVREGKDV